MNKRLEKLGALRWGYRTFQEHIFLPPTPVLSDGMEKLICGCQQLCILFLNQRYVHTAGCQDSRGIHSLGERQTLRLLINKAIWAQIIQASKISINSLIGLVSNSSILDHRFWLADFLNMLNWETNEFIIICHMSSFQTFIAPGKSKTKQTRLFLVKLVDFIRWDLLKRIPNNPFLSDYFPKPI